MEKLNWKGKTRQMKKLNELEKEILDLLYEKEQKEKLTKAELQIRLLIYRKVNR